MPSLHEQVPDECDILIVGAGSGAACAAYTLARTGANVVLLERGIWRSSPAWPSEFDNDELMQRHRYLKRAAGPHEDEFSEIDIEGDKSKRHKAGSTLGVVGGYSVFYAGSYWRFRRQDFLKGRIYQQQLEALVPESQRDDFSLLDWPTDQPGGFYDELRPYYEVAERLLGVSGDDNEGGNLQRPETEPRPWMQPPLPYHGVNEVLARKAQTSLGWRPFHIPMGISSVRNAENGTRPCVSCNFCSGSPCVWRAKNSVDETLLRPLVDNAPNVTLCTGVVARRIVMDSRRAVGVRYSLTSERGDVELRQVRCKLLLLAAGGVQSTRLIMLSGIHTLLDQVPIGRYLMFHGDVKRGAFFNAPEVIRDGGGMMVKKLAILDHYLAGTLDGDELVVGRRAQGALDHVNHFSLQTGSKAGPAGFLSEFPVSDIARFAQHYEMQAIVEDLPRASNRVTLSDAGTDQFGDKQAHIRYDFHDLDRNACREAVRDLELLLQGFESDRKGKPAKPNVTHLMGTLRMGVSEHTSVVDRSCVMHGIENIVVVDGSVFTTSSGLNPILTIQANAFRVADRISKRLHDFNIRPGGANE